MNLYTNKVVLITGASSGIGKALAQLFNRQGAIVIAAARNTAELEKIRVDLKHPANYHVLSLDLENSGDFNEVVAKLIAQHQRIDVLVNNGGISQRSNTIDTPMEIDRKIMEVNYFGNIALTKAVLPYMRKQSKGSIIVISSIAGKFGFYLRSAYSASKHALHGFYESLRLEEEGNGLQVVLVCPGKVATNISVNALKEDGTTHNTMDEQQAKGVSTEFCAEQIVLGMEKNKEEIYIGGREIKAVTVRRFFPKMFGKIIRKQPRE